MTLLVAWFVFPLVLAALSVGCGLLVQRGLAMRIPLPLLPAAGLATIIVVAQFPTLADATAELATPLVVALAIVGFGIGALPRIGRSASWGLAAAAAVYVVYAAPIVLSGDATFAGYIRLDDTATWMTLTDRVMEHGRDLDGLAPSTYEAVLAFNLGDGYPVGVFLPLGIAQQLVGTDLAWLVQPYMAFLATLLALALWELGRSLVREPWLRALAAFIAAQSALLVGYYLWGGIKEAAAAALIATAAALIAAIIRERFPPGAPIALAIVGAAVIGVLSGGGAIWLAPILLAAAMLALRILGPSAALGRALAFTGLLALLCLPVIIPGALVPPTSSPLTDANAIGNLFAPLDKLQLFGIWPAGDFRGKPADLGPTHVLIAVVAAGAFAGLYAAWRARSLALPLYVVGTLISCGTILVVGSPWVEAKALATASPALPFAAAVGAAALYAAERRVEGAVLMVALAGGVLWSNALAYRDAALAPRDQLAELEEIGEEITGEGPTLMTEYQPYGVRHFLREAEPEAASELRRRRVPLAGGGVLKKGEYADTDQLQLEGLTTYRTLVLRRSPTQSRPPSPYRLVWSGDYYEVWQRPLGAERMLLAHLALGNEVEPGGRPACGRVRDIAAQAGRRGTLVAARRAPVIFVPLRITDHPSSWRSPEYESALLPDGPGEVEARVQVARSGRYEIWLGGSVRQRVEVAVDGRATGSVRHHLNNEGQYVRLGAAELGRGTHSVELRFDGPDLHPGSGPGAVPIGPLLLSADGPAEAELVAVPPRRAASLCGGRWDWIEAIGG